LGPGVRNRVIPNEVGTSHAPKLKVYTRGARHRHERFAHPGLQREDILPHRVARLHVCNVEFEHLIGVLLHQGKDRGQRGGEEEEKKKKKKGEGDEYVGQVQKGSMIRTEQYEAAASQHVKSSNTIARSTPLGRDMTELLLLSLFMEMWGQGGGRGRGDGRQYSIRALGINVCAANTAQQGVPHTHDPKR